jgi:hypothetical protein
MRDEPGRADPLVVTNLPLKVRFDHARAVPIPQVVKTPGLRVELRPLSGHAAGRAVMLPRQGDTGRTNRLKGWRRIPVSLASIRRQFAAAIVKNPSVSEVLGHVRSDVLVCVVACCQWAGAGAGRFFPCIAGT